MSTNAKYLVAGGILYAILSVLALQDYIVPTSTNFLLGVLALIVCTRITNTGRSTYRFGIATLLVLPLIYLVPAKTIIYLELVMAAAFLVESFGGRLNALPLIVLGFISPIFEYLTNVFSFPIRLLLTKWVGILLNSIDTTTLTEGNVVVVNGIEFSVDPSCMGLSMLTASLLTCIMLVATWEKKYNRRLALPTLSVSLLTVLLFNLVSNLIRIIILVYFRLLPDSAMHDIAGLACFLIYILIPTAFLTRFIVKRYGEVTIASETAFAPLKYGILINASILVFTAIPVLTATPQQASLKPASLPSRLLKYDVRSLDGNVTRLSNDSVLIYIKPIMGFYSSDHQPMICWKGSGYTFKKVQEQNVDQFKVYQGILQKGNEILYTAWWYDNGSSATISQLEWRWNALKNGSEYALVNVSASSTSELAEQIRYLRAGKALQMLHTN